MKIKVTISKKVEDALLALYPKKDKDKPDKQQIMDVMGKMLNSKLEAYVTQVAIENRDTTTGDDIDVTEDV